MSALARMRRRLSWKELCKRVAWVLPREVVHECMNRVWYAVVDQRGSDCSVTEITNITFLDAVAMWKEAEE